MTTAVDTFVPVRPELRPHPADHEVWDQPDKWEPGDPIYERYLTEGGNGHILDFPPRRQRHRRRRTAARRRTRPELPHLRVARRPG